MFNKLKYLIKNVLIIDQVS